MESRINHEILRKYAQDFTEKVCQQYFSSQTHIENEDLMKLCEPHQVNLLAVKSIFRNWYNYNESIQTQYFDFENDNVLKAQNTFANTLSRHIKISQTNFRPLLEEAVYECLLLLFSPYEFYRKTFSSLGKTIDLSELTQEAKFIKINKHLLQAFVAQSKGESLSIDDAYALFDKVCTSSDKIPEDFGPYIDLFSKTLPLSVDAIYGEKETATLNETFETPPSINEKIKKVEPARDVHKGKSIDNIDKALTLNQRYMFLNQLFKGNNTRFGQAIEKIQNCSTQDEAISLVKKQYAPELEWDMESEEVAEFMELIERKFLATKS